MLALHAAEERDREVAGTLADVLRPLGDAPPPRRGGRFRCAGRRAPRPSPTRSTGAEAPRRAARRWRADAMRRPSRRARGRSRAAGARRRAPRTRSPVGRASATISSASARRRSTSSGVHTDHWVVRRTAARTPGSPTRRASVDRLWTERALDAATRRVGELLGEPRHHLRAKRDRAAREERQCLLELGHDLLVAYDRAEARQPARERQRRDRDGGRLAVLLREREGAAADLARGVHPPARQRAPARLTSTSMCVGASSSRPDAPHAERTP